ncbi:MAG TPA: tyrosine-type recombinase/integrase [Planctomycetota bacterium]|jgi:site-specific recombinase XerD|nr:tyrosine-type recombinase/integrase [Planctomycetota bacterium]
MPTDQAKATKPGSVPPAPPSPAIPADLNKVVRRYTASLIAPRTRIEYEKALRDFFAKAGVSSLAELLAMKSDQIVDYRNKLQELRLSPATIKMRLSAVSGIFAQLVIDGHLDGNPADPRVVKRAKVSDVSRSEGLLVDEVKAMLATCPGNTLIGLRDRALLMTLFYQGLRRSEASNLDWRDITTKRGLLEVRQAKTSAYDVVRIHPEVRKAIDDYHGVLNLELRRGDTKPQDPVFMSHSRRAIEGRRLSPTAINEIVKEHARLAGIEKRTHAHAMRHYVAKRIMSRSFSLDLLQLYVSAGGSSSPLAKQVRKVLGAWFNPTRSEVASTSRREAAG